MTLSTGCCRGGWEVRDRVFAVPALQHEQRSRLHPPHRRLLHPLQHRQVLRDRDRLHRGRGVGAWPERHQHIGHGHLPLAQSNRASEGPRVLKICSVHPQLHNNGWVFIHFILKLTKSDRGLMPVLLLACLNLLIYRSISANTIIHNSISSAHR